MDAFKLIMQADIDSFCSIPLICLVLDAMTGTDMDGTRVAITNIHLSDTGNKRIQNAELHSYIGSMS